MTKPIARDPIYRRRRFQGETIELCVRWYISGDELATVAAQGNARWSRTESSSIAASATGGPEVEARGGEKLSLPQQYRRTGSSRDQTSVRLHDGL